MPLAPGDVILMKEPFSGGPGRDRLALITAFNADSDGEAKWLAATTIHHSSLAQLRLPPVPLRHGGQVNTAVLEGLAGAQKELLLADAQLQQARMLFHRKGIREHFSRAAMNETIRTEQAWMAAWIAELPEGEAAVELNLPTGETLRMRWHCDGHRLAIDLSGTSNAFQLRVPFAATCGLLWTSLRERLGLPQGVDSFSSDVLPLTIPNGCFLNATSGDCDRGLNEITPWIQWAVELLIHRWDRRKSRGLVNPFDLGLRLEFANHEILELSIPTGGPAFAELEGNCFWQQRRGQAPLSLENLEKSWPIQFIRVDEKAPTGSSAKTAGGRGLLLEFDLKAPAKFRWSGASPTAQKIERHQSHPKFNDVSLLRHGEKIVLAAAQDFELRAGDRLTLCSGSGGDLLAVN